MTYPEMIRVEVQTAVRLTRLPDCVITHCVHCDAGVPDMCMAAAMERPAADPTRAAAPRRLSNIRLLVTMSGVDP
jgi:hypothetical protein